MTSEKKYLLSDVNIIAIVIGLLIGRVVIVWAMTLASYSRFRMCGCEVKRSEEYLEFDSSYKGAILVTVVVALFIVMIYSWYKKSICIENIGKSRVDGSANV